MFDTTFLRFVAIWLITNSYLDKRYPVSAMATGGQLGNSLFFMLSGFGVAPLFDTFRTNAEWHLFSR
jgi:peptidoglycan/LPS O-acetylase OafA/YrhL